MTRRVGVVHSGDSIGGIVGSYFFQAYGWTSVGDCSAPTSCAQATYYNGEIISRDLAISSSKLASGPYNLVTIAPTYIDTVIPVAYSAARFNTTRKYIFTCAIGSNDGALGGYANATLYAGAVATACVARKTAGFNLALLCTLLPRNDGNLLEVNRLEYNACLNSSVWRTANGIDGVCDLAGQAIMGNPLSCSNPTYYVDGVHPTDAGFALLAPIYTAAVNAAIATL